VGNAPAWFHMPATGLNSGNVRYFVQGASVRAEVWWAPSSAGSQFERLVANAGVAELRGRRRQALHRDRSPWQVAMALASGHKLSNANPFRPRELGVRLNRELPAGREPNVLTCEFRRQRDARGRRVPGSGWEQSSCEQPSSPRAQPQPYSHRRRSRNSRVEVQRRSRISPAYGPTLLFPMSNLR
jgi:hypothetical protein